MCEFGGRSKEVERCWKPALYQLDVCVGNTERQEEKLQVAENNWVRRICKVKRKDRRKMGELREEIGMKKHLNMKLVGSRLRWSGYIQRMSEGNVVKTELKYSFRTSAI